MSQGDVLSSESQSLSVNWTLTCSTSRTRSSVGGEVRTPPSGTRLNKACYRRALAGCLCLFVSGYLSLTPTCPTEAPGLTV